MHNFYLYLQIGIQHICNLQNYNHILFAAVLCGTNRISSWKKILFVIVAFTVGYAVTLALGVFNIIQINNTIIRFLIPITILIAALNNILKRKRWHKTINPIYFLALFFGLIHGLEYAGYLRSLTGKSILMAQLFAFALGLLCGQILIVISVLLLSLMLIRTFEIKQSDWRFFLSSAIFGIALIMCIDRFQQIIFR